MIRIFNKVVFSLLLFVFAVSCQSNGEKKRIASSNSQQLSQEINNDHSTERTKNVQRDNAIYKKYCLVCHQADGSGVPGMYPPLGPGSWVGKDPKELVMILTKGLSGKVEVNGEIYKNAMPAQSQLTDQEIADVLTYIRSYFGNNFDPVNADFVRKVRSGK
jgi:mono/diheme cytochrome c family protein